MEIKKQEVSPRATKRTFSEVVSTTLHSVSTALSNAYSTYVEDCTEDSLSDIFQGHDKYEVEDAIFHVLFDDEYKNGVESIAASSDCFDSMVVHPIDEPLYGLRMERLGQYRDSTAVLVNQFNIKLRGHDIARLCIPEKGSNALDYWLNDNLLQYY